MPVDRDRHSSTVSIHWHGTARHLAMFCIAIDTRVSQFCSQMAKEVRTVAAVMCMPKYQKAVSVAIVRTALQEISLFCSCVLDMLQ